MSAPATDNVVENYRSHIAQELFYVEGKPFSLKDYPMYPAIYDGHFPKLLLKTGRQVAKCVPVTSLVSLGDGRRVAAGTITRGMRVASLNLPGHVAQMTTAPVSWVSKVIQKSCLRITTRLGHTLDIADTHPVRTWNGWTQGADLCVGDSVASVRRAGEFHNENVSDSRVCLTAYLIGDGQIGPDINFTSIRRRLRTEFISCLTDIGATCRAQPKAKTEAISLRVHRGSVLDRWLQKDGLWGSRSATKFIPPWVFRLPRASTALFLNRLWSTDGWVGKKGIEYGSISLQLAKDVQALLWKFGIPSRLRADNPKLFRLRGEVRLAYRVRIETKEGREAFLKEIGSFMKSHYLWLRNIHPTSNNNRDTFPRVAAKQIQQAVASVAANKRKGRYSAWSLFAAGLRFSPKYKLSRPKFQHYIEQLRKCSDVDTTQLAALEQHLCPDVYWDTVISIEPIGKQDCVDFTVDGTHNFVVEGVITHNSTTIATFMIAECVGTPFFKQYYISPSAEQTRKFSHTRTSKILGYSPDLRKFFVGPESINNVYLSMLKNGSEMAFTYADDDPDRTRGFSADRASFDEVQDMIFEAVIPVVEESMGASKYGYSTYCGTPKTMENSIELLWSLSSQTEWCIKCDSCGKSTFIDSVKAIGKHGPECLNCRKLLNPRKGRWVDMKAGQKIKGFHISQPMMPYNVPAAWPLGSAEYKLALDKWDNMLFKLENWGEVKFLNECIGVSTSTGARLLTKEILEALCDENHTMTRLPLPNSLDGILRTVAGVDWSGGGGEVKGMEGLLKSRTVLHIAGEMADGRLKTLFYKIFPNMHPVGWIDEIVELCLAWNIQMIVGDAGEGALANSLLRERLGHHRVQQARYMALSKPMVYNPDTFTYHCDRTTLIDSYALSLKNGKAVFPCLAQMHPAIADILNIYEETTLAGRKIWQHAPTQPDDCFHSMLFTSLAQRILNGDTQFYT